MLTYEHASIIRETIFCKYILYQNAYCIKLAALNWFLCNKLLYQGKCGKLKTKLFMNTCRFINIGITCTSANETI